MSSAPRDRVLGHADEADGIEEYDNPMPAWWLGIFYVTVIFGIIYATHYHFMGGRSQVGDYEAELAAAAEMWPAPDAGALATADPAKLAAAGAAVYQANCIACHGANLEGGIGANLMDAEWIHGGTFEDIQNTVNNGVLEKGMPAWGSILGPQKVAEVSAYVYQTNKGS